MNKTYAAKRLLEHGPLTAKEFLEITGWESQTAKRTLRQLLDTGVVTYRHQWAPQRQHNGHSKIRLYELAA